jgi:protein-S-isoprenylcysteine O-methyltransferase Ste14
MKFKIATYFQWAKSKQSYAILLQSILSIGNYFMQYITYTIVIALFSVYTAIRIYFRIQKYQAIKHNFHNQKPPEQIHTDNKPKHLSDTKLITTAVIPLQRSLFEPRWFRTLRIFSVVVFVALTILYTITRHLPSLFIESTNLDWPILLRICALVISLLGLWLLAWSHSTLGRYWTPELSLEPHHALITDGPYKYMRHPMYTGLFCFFGGTSIFAANLILIIPAFFVIILMYIRIFGEERMMLDHFGVCYQQYMLRSGRLLPKWQGKVQTKSNDPLEPNFAHFQIYPPQNTVKPKTQIESTEG